MSEELPRIRQEYDRREREIPAEFYALDRPANLFLRQSQHRALLAAVDQAGCLPLAGVPILEVGCGGGDYLEAFTMFGAQPKQLAAIELDERRAQAARQRVPGADIRVGDAQQLPFESNSFQIVFQGTVFTSILDSTMQATVATEMLRVLRPGGCILWYDFFMNNPRNPHVRGVGRRRIRELFPGCQVRLRRVTLAPPLARRVVPISWTAGALLEALRIFNTHYFGILRSGE